MKVAVGKKPIGTLFAYGQIYINDIVLESWCYFDSNDIFINIFNVLFRLQTIELKLNHTHTFSMGFAKIAH